MTTEAAGTASALTPSISTAGPRESEIAFAQEVVLKLRGKVAKQEEHLSAARIALGEAEATLFSLENPNGVE